MKTTVQELEVLVSHFKTKGEKERFTISFFTLKYLFLSLIPSAIIPKGRRKLYSRRSKAFFQFFTLINSNTMISQRRILLYEFY